MRQINLRPGRLCQGDGILERETHLERSVPKYRPSIKQDNNQAEDRYRASISTGDCNEILDVY